MTHIQILLPFGLPPATMAADLTKALITPSLGTLISHAKSPKPQIFEDFSRSLPHEICLANQFGLGHPSPYLCSAPMAVAAMQALGLTPTNGTWFILNPVHIHIARDHLVLTDQRQLNLAEEDAHALFDSAKAYFDEVGKTLLYGDALTWFVQADDWADLQTSTPDAACGHNIDIWMPQGESGLPWRKLQNEVQMLWHTHRVNEARESLGLMPVNSLWLWGGANFTNAQTPRTNIGASVDDDNLQAPVGTNTLQTAQPSFNYYSSTFNLAGWNSAFSTFERNTQGYSADEVIAIAPRHGLVLLDQLIAPALASDWSEWLAQIHQLENEWFTPMLRALKARKIDEVSLILTHGTSVTDFSVTKNSLRKFWVKPSLSRLLP